MVKITGFFQTSKKLGTYNKWSKQGHYQVRIAKSPKLVARHPEIKDRRLVRAIFYTVPADDTVLVVMD
jgi:hypothetical protein